MSTKKVTLTVDALGVTKIEAEGYAGGTCLDATAAFESLFSSVSKPREAVDDCALRRDDGERVRS